MSPQVHLSPEQKNNHKDRFFFSLHVMHVFKIIVSSHRLTLGKC